MEAGARRVYALERLEPAYLQARELVERLGLDDRIIVIHGDATETRLPEPVDEPPMERKSVAPEVATPSSA